MKKPIIFIVFTIILSRLGFAAKTPIFLEMNLISTGLDTKSNFLLNVGDIKVLNIFKGIGLGIQVNNLYSSFMRTNDGDESERADNVESNFGFNINFTPIAMPVKVYDKEDNMMKRRYGIVNLGVSIYPSASIKYYGYQDILLKEPLTDYYVTIKYPIFSYLSMEVRAGYLSVQNIASESGIYISFILNGGMIFTFKDEI